MAVRKGNTAAGSFVSASASGAAVNVTSVGGSVAADMTISGSATPEETEVGWGLQQTRR